MRTLCASSTLFAIVVGLAANACSDKQQYAENSLMLKDGKIGVSAGDVLNQGGSSNAGTGDVKTRTVASGEAVGVDHGHADDNERKSEESSSSGGSSSGGTNTGRPMEIMGGIVGGNFDLDTYSKTDPSGFTNLSEEKHTHQYGGYNSSGVDFFALRDSQTKNIHTVIPAGVPFVLVVYNSALSSAAVLNVNGNKVLPKAIDGEFVNVNSLPVYSIGSALVSGATALTSLSVNFSTTANNTLDGTILKVDPSDAQKPVLLNSRYRSGAFTIRAVRAADVNRPATDSTGVLWESALYCHDCVK